MENAEEKVKSCRSKPGSNRGGAKLPSVPEFKLSAPASLTITEYDTEYDTPRTTEYGTDGTRYLSFLSRAAKVV